MNKQATFKITGVSNLTADEVKELNSVFDAIAQEVLGVFLDLQNGKLTPEVSTLSTPQRNFTIFSFSSRIPQMKIFRLQTFRSVLPTCKRLLGILILISIFIKYIYPTLF